MGHDLLARADAPDHIARVDFYASPGGGSFSVNDTQGPGRLVLAAVLVVFLLGQRRLLLRGRLLRRLGLGREVGAHRLGAVLVVQRADAPPVQE